MDNQSEPVQAVPMLTVPNNLSKLTQPQAVVALIFTLAIIVCLTSVAVVGIILLVSNHPKPIQQSTPIKSPSQSPQPVPQVKAVKTVGTFPVEILIFGNTTIVNVSDKDWKKIKEHFPNRVQKDFVTINE